MLNLDQVRLLENKVERAVQMIKSLHTEKDALKRKLKLEIDEFPSWRSL